MEWKRENSAIYSGAQGVVRLDTLQYNDKRVLSPLMKTRRIYSMATPLLEEQALAKLNDLFHDEFLRFRQDHIQSSESIFAVAECSCRGFAETSSGGYFGFFVLTNERALLNFYQAFPKREQIRFYEEGHGFFYHTLTDESIFGLPPSAPLMESELRTQQVQHVMLSMIETVERSAYSTTIEDHLFQCLELNYKGSGRGPDGWLGSVGLWRTLFDAREGQTIYNMLHGALTRTGGRIEVTYSRDEMLQRLERLADLYQKGMLTQAEFEAGKKRLLGM